jgi:hypothetical protein
MLLSLLAWVKQNYVRDNTLTAANAKLVSAQNRIALAHVWGGGEVASADGMRFVVPIRTVHAGPNPKYFGQLKGVTWYNLLSDQFTGCIWSTISSIWNSKSLRIDPLAWCAVVRTRGVARNASTPKPAYRAIVSGRDGFRAVPFFSLLPGVRND